MGTELALDVMRVYAQDPSTGLETALLQNGGIVSLNSIGDGVIIRQRLASSSVHPACLVRSVVVLPWRVHMERRQKQQQPTTKTIDGCSPNHSAYAAGQIDHCTTTLHTWRFGKGNPVDEFCLITSASAQLAPPKNL